MAEEQNETAIPLRWVFIKAFFSLSMYRSIAKHWRIRAFRYLFVLCLILMVPLTIRFMINFDHYKAQLIKPIVKQLPQRMQIKNGELSVKPDKTYWISLPPHDEEIAVIDTHNKISKQFSSLPVQAIIGQSGFFLKYQGDIFHVAYNPQNDIVITPQNFWHSIKRFTYWLYIIEFAIFYFVGLFVLYLFYILYSFLLTSFTSICAGLADYRMPIVANWQITIVGSTVSSSLWALLFLINWLNLPTIALGLVIQFIYLLVIAISITSSFSDQNPKRQTVCG